MVRRRHEWREKTRRQIEDLCNRATAYFGEGAALQLITADRASQFWAQARMLREGSEGHELSRFSRNRILRDAKTMFKYAVEWGHLSANPFARIKLLRVGKHSQRRWHFIKPAEYLALLKAAPNLRWKVIYALAYTSAARCGELFNLMESSLDLRRGRLLIRNRAETADVPPFTVKDHEEREIPLPRHTIKLVAGWLRTRPRGSPLILLTPARFKRVQVRWQECARAGKPWVNDFLENNVLTTIRRHAGWAGLKLDGQLTMHAFRKSCGQNWANHLPMNVVKELMGHADISTTAEFYSTVTEEYEAHVQWVTQAITLGVSRMKTDARLTPALENGPKRKAI
jgi:integrase